MKPEELLFFLQSKYPKWVSIGDVILEFGQQGSSKISQKLNRLERANEIEVRDETGQPRRWRAIISGD